MRIVRRGVGSHVFERPSVMAPGIMFLAGSQPAPPAAAAGSTAAGNGAANRPPTENGEQPNSVSPPQTRTADTAAGLSNKEPPRSDSPGYFTLSDSDGASNPGTESPQEDEVKAGGFKVEERRRKQEQQQQQHQKQQQQRHQVYKMFKSPSRPLSASAASSPRTGKLILAARPNSDREKSKTPPRPSPPKGYSRRDSCGSDRGMTPPRPPPPLSYTSTLPPPVPKKTRPKTPTKTPTSGAKAPNQQQHFKTIPAVRRNSSSASSGNRKSSPAATASSTLPRVQPLQMQSPSMIKALTKSVSTASESTPPLPPKERKSPPKEKTPPTPKKPKTFVQAFQSANHGSNNNRASPPPRGKGPSITPRPTKTSTVRASSSSSRTSPGKDASPPPPRSPSEPGASSRRSSVASTKASAEALKKAVMKTLQVNGRQESKKDKKGAAAAAVGGEPLSAKDAKKNSLEKIGAEPPKPKSPSPRRSSKSLSATAIEKIRERRNRSKDRAKKGEEREQRKNSSIMPKKINSLIKHYESGARESKDDEDAPASNRSSGLSASQLSRLSQLSADELHSWLSSPVSYSANLDKSMTEIDVLDQCVSEMMSFTTDALTTDTDSDTLKSGVFLNMLERQRTSTEDDDVRKSVQQIIDKIESIESRPPVKPERTRKRERVLTASPSDDDLSHGVFTEVSFAGSFSSGISVAAPEAPKEATEGKVEPPPPPPPPPPLPAKTSAKKGPRGDDIGPKAPIPSPRTKRRARKEQMLLEHKAQGREALSVLKSQSASCVPNGACSPPSSESAVGIKSSASYQEGLECLEQLCSMSRGIERESGTIFRSRPPPPPRQAESPTDDCDDDKDAKSCGAGDEEKVCRGFLRAQRSSSFFVLPLVSTPFLPAILWRPFIRRAYVLWPY